MLNWFKNLFSNKEEKLSQELNFLIAGLGNIGAEYDETRHNIGFEIVDFVAQKHECTFKQERLAYYTTFRTKGRAFHLIKPTTFMNLSGKSVKYWMDKLKIKQENVLVVLDDLNLDFGKQRLRKKGNHGGHNGLKDIDEKLGNSNYARLKFGIGNNFPRGKQIDYVLGKWSNEEFADLPEMITKSEQIIVSFAAIGIDRTMTQFN